MTDDLRALAEAARQPLMPHMDYRQQVALDRARVAAAAALSDVLDERDALRAEVERLRAVEFIHAGCQHLHDRDVTHLLAVRDAAWAAIQRVRSEVAKWSNLYQDDRIQVYRLIERINEALDGETI